jgi:hypothetical protein
MVLTRMQLYELQLFQHLFINDLDDMEEETIKAN